MFYLPPDPLEQPGAGEAGRFPLTRSEMQPTIDAAAEIETTWWEPDQIDEIADKQDARLREFGLSAAYPRGAQKRALGGSDAYGLFTGAEFGLEAVTPDDPKTALAAYNDEIKRVREMNPELSDLRTTDEAEYDWLQVAQTKRKEADAIKQHSGDGLTDPASLAELWAGVKTGVQEPANIVAAGVSVMSGFAMAPALAGASIFTRIGAPVLMDSLYGAGAQYTISDRLEDLRIRLGYTPEQVKEMKWQETATAFGLSAVLGGVWEGGSLAVRRLFRGSGPLGEAVTGLESPDPATRMKAADQIEATVNLTDEEAAALAATRRQANLELTAPVVQKDLAAYMSKLDGAEAVAKGGDPDPGWFARLATMYDSDSPRMAGIRSLTDKAATGERVTLEEIRELLDPAQRVRFERELSQTPKAESIREVAFDYRDLSADGKKLFKDLEAGVTRIVKSELPEDELARQRAYLLARIDTAVEADRAALTHIRERLVHDDYEGVNFKRRIVETRPQTERSDMLRGWLRELRGEYDQAQARVAADVARARNQTVRNVLADQPQFGPVRLVREANQAAPEPITDPAQAKAAWDRLNRGPQADPADLKLGDDIAAGKYDEAIRDSEKDLLERFGDQEIADPVTGQTRKLRDVVTDNNDNIAGLTEILGCMKG